MRTYFACILTTCVYTFGAELSVAAASDLSRVGPELARAYQGATGVTVRFSYASSGALARQIENGAPFDVFLSANQAYVDEGIRRGWLRQGSARTYAIGHLALWSRSGKFRTPADLRSPSVLHIAIASPAHAPYGAAAKEALERAGLWEALNGKLVYGENIRQALQFAESGNAEAAIVAWSLVFDRGGFRLASNTYKPIRQSGAVVARSDQAAAASRFLDFLATAAGKAVLAKFGFEAVAP